MGLNWSSEDAMREREKKAAECLHELVWDTKRTLSAVEVRGVLDANGLSCVTSVQWLRNNMKNAEAEQDRRVLAFMRNGAHDWADYHKSISTRYRLARAALLKLMYPDIPDCSESIQVVPRS